MANEPRAKLLVDQLPGLLGPRALRFSVNRYGGERCQGGHALPKGRFVRVWHGTGESYYDMSYCMACAEKNGWVKIG